MQRVDVPWAALAPVVLLCVGFVIYCIVDVVRGEVRYLPKWAWVVICLISIPFGAIVYLAVGKRR